MTPFAINAIVLTMRRLLTLLALLPCATAQAEPAGVNFPQTYRVERAHIQAQMDSCDLINARDVLSLASQQLLELEGDLPRIRHLFDTTAISRLDCYTQSRLTLDKLLDKGNIYLTTHDEDTLFARQLELDTALREAIPLRARISAQLLRSMLNDAETSISAYVTNGGKKKKTEAFVDESPLTRSLIKQDMDMILEMERRQQNLDEVRIVSSTPKVQELADIKLAKAHHYFSRALMSYEDMHLSPRLYPLARLNTDFAYANAQFAELFAFAPKLEGLDRDLARSIARTADKSTVIALDIEGAIRDLRNGLFEEDYNNWLSELYQDMSSLTLDLQTQRAALNPLIQAPQNTPTLSELEAAFDAAQDAANLPQAVDGISPDELPAHMLDGQTRIQRLLSEVK